MEPPTSRKVAHVPVNLNDPPAPAKATVYVTRGRKYHADLRCPLMVNGENLWDGDGEDWSHFAGSYRREEPTPQRAAMCGKLPCLHCVPAELRAFPPLYGQTFGHRPVIGFIDGRALTQVCASCYTINHAGPRFFGTRRQPVRWPCTSAIILGLVDRAEAPAVTA